MSDLTPLANLTGLVDAALAKPRRNGLSFLDCPLTDEYLLKLSRAENPTRTVETINYLRSQDGLLPHQVREGASEDPEDASYDFDGERIDALADYSDVELPSADVLPMQSPLALTFSSASEGPLKILPDAVFSEIDEEQAELYKRLRGQLTRFLEEIPSQERSQVTEAVEDSLRQPLRWEEVRHKKILWLCGNALRSILSQHDAVSDDPDPHYAKLPPVVAESLRRPVETWNIVVLGDPTLRDLDARRLGPREEGPTANQLATAEPILAAAFSDSLIVSSDAASAIEISLTAARSDVDSIHVRQAQVFARDTTQNFILQILRGAHRIAQDLHDPQSDEAKSFVKEYKGGIYKKLGEWSVTGAVAGGVSLATAASAAIYYYGLPFLEFVAANAPWLKAYLAITFENRQLLNVVDAVTALRARILQSAGSEEASE